MSTFSISMQVTVRDSKDVKGYQPALPAESLDNPWPAFLAGAELTALQSAIGKRAVRIVGDLDSNVKPAILAKLFQMGAAELIGTAASPAAATQQAELFRSVFVESYALGKGAATTRLTVYREPFAPKLPGYASKALARRLADLSKAARAAESTAPVGPRPNSIETPAVAPVVKSSKSSRKSKAA